jgi:zinc/manganese transport system substrate-binding protein
MLAQMVMRTVIVLAGAGVAILAGCGSGGGSTHGLDVVASTNVYGDIARQIGGSDVHVTSILSDPNADPHLFEPATRSGLAVARARVLIANGLGYDDFMTKLADASPNTNRISVVAADVLGVHGQDANPHLWYDLPQMPRVARAIGAAFVRADPAHARSYRNGVRRFTQSLAAFATVHVPRGRLVAYTEPLPGYLVDALHLRNLAPTAFTRAIQNGSEPPASAVADMESLLQDHRVDALLYNSQAVSPITQRVREVAESSHVPVVGVTETLPSGTTYQQWQLEQLRALRQALLQ